METYRRLCTEFYELDKPHAPENELAFYAVYAINAGGPIFEPMCGTGRFLIPLLEHGLDVDGLDASEHMLAVCQQKCLTKNLHPKLYQQFLHEFVSDKKYNLIFIPTGSLGLITRALEIKKCLAILYDLLLPNGKLVFEVETLHAVPKELGAWQTAGRSHITADKSKLILSTLSTYDAATQILKTVWRYQLIKENKILVTENEDFQVRLYQQYEMDECLKEAGFQDIVRFNSHSPETRDNNEVIIYECVKH
jgi:SAM-dependent methyltransferase